MKVQPECAACFLKRVNYETCLVDESKAPDTVKAAAKVFGEFGKDINSARLATMIHARVYAILGGRDIYADMKRRSNLEAKRLLPKAERLIRNARNSFKSAVVCSIIGNVLDFGIGTYMNKPEELRRKFDILYRGGLGIDHTKKMKELISKSSEVIYFADNAGEILFDTLLIKEIKRLGPRIVLVVRGEPILTDATMEEVDRLHLGNLVDDVMTTNAFAVGIDFSKITPALRRKLENAEFILSKGMANWESFSDVDYHPIAYLMRAKCEPVARSIGVKKDTSVAILRE